MPFIFCTNCERAKGSVLMFFFSALVFCAEPPLLRYGKGCFGHCAGDVKTKGDSDNWTGMYIAIESFRL